ncbi:MAG: hypothetical protein JXC85_01090 [Candidatus Aenigmarchaeota archaeon]|nr:hypothetical protein [Candidatus Aenigmarchaeota archaeon]
MNRRSFLISLIATLIFSQPALAAEPSMDIVFPFTEAANETIIARPYLHQSFLEYLHNQSVYPVIGDDGVPLFYYSGNGSYGCTGICGNITMNNYVLGSERLDAASLEGLNVIDESVVVGNREMEDFIDIINGIRTALADNPQALGEFEKQMLGDQEDFLTSTYYGNAYDDVFDYAIDDIMKDPEIYDSLTRNVRSSDLEGAVQDLERYLGENFDIDEAYDLSNLYSALNDKKIGPVQLEEFMRNVLDSIAEMENAELDTHDLGRYSDLLNSDEFKKAAEKAADMIKENPEAFGDVIDMANEALDDPATLDMFREAVDKLFESADWESVNEVLDLFNKLDNKEQLLETLMEGFTGHMRELVREGKIDEIKGMLQDPQMLETMMKATETFSQTFLEMLGDWAKEIPIEFAYIIAIAATIATLIMLAKIKI